MIKAGQIVSWKQPEEAIRLHGIVMIVDEDRIVLWNSSYNTMQIASLQWLYEHELVVAEV